MKLISFVLASNRPANVQGLIENLDDTVQDPGSLEVLIKVDEEDKETQAVVRRMAEKVPFPVKIEISPKGRGVLALYRAYQRLYDESDPEYYFIMFISDEVRFRTRHWDSILARYVDLYPDKVFRLRLSENKYRQYRYFDDCLPYPENFPIATRFWHETVGGVGDFWGVDNWHQVIEFELSKLPNADGTPGIYRSIPIEDIELDGIHAGVGHSVPQRYERNRLITLKWRDLNRRLSQENIRRLACRLAAHVYAGARQISSFEITEDASQKVIILHDLETGNPKLDEKLSYAISAKEYVVSSCSRWFGLQKPGFRPWLLDLLIEMPNFVRVALEPFARLAAFGIARRWCRQLGQENHCLSEDRELRQVHVRQKNDEEPVKVISYRLVLGAEYSF